jgi:hypothetical protein
MRVDARSTFGRLHVGAENERGFIWYGWGLIRLVTHGDYGNILSPVKYFQGLERRCGFLQIDFAIPSNRML